MPNDLTYTAEARIPTTRGEFQLLLFKNSADHKEHLAFVMGELCGKQGVLTRVHSECFTGDVLGSTRCDCGSQLHSALEMIEAEGCGIVIYLRQEGRGIGLAQKLRAYNLQDMGHDTVDANLLLGHQADERRYDAAAAILNHLQVRSIRLLTNNPTKIEQLSALGIQVDKRISMQPLVTADNSSYLQTKIKRMGHILSLGADALLHKNGVNGFATPATHIYSNQFSPEIIQQLNTLQQQANTHFANTGRPFVTISYAQSLDGSLAAARGRAMALSSPASMQLTHALRASHDAILIGVETLLADDPRLNVRLVDGSNPQPVVVDSCLRTPAQARLFDEHAHVWIATTSASAQRCGEKGAALVQRGATILPCPANAQNQVDLSCLLHMLGQHNIRSLMIEGGAHILTSLLAAGLADFAVVTIAPVYVGGYRVVQPQPEYADSAPHFSSPIRRA
ncbi:MAG: GTP cyclohydrolase II [Caldilineaceae bacterium]